MSATDLHPSGSSSGSSGGELRRLPGVDRLIDLLRDGLPRRVAAEAARAAIDEARAAIMAGSKAPSPDELAARALSIARATGRRRLATVINATGVLLHTNLGRAPLSRAAIEAVGAIGAGYSNLEYDLEVGSRGSRYEHAAELIIALTGAESALVVNNNAAAVLLALMTLASGREVVISRGELIEIGGEFRIPDILAASGATLNEVGTTNRTHLRDYEQAIGPSTAAIMKVHPSNYRVIGFSSSVDAGALAELAHARGIVLIHDLGSGLVRRRVGELEPPWLAAEPTVVEALADGADVVTFSGDKLLGGPQCGVLVGRREAISGMLRCPLLRALRVDKTTLAALQATLLAYVDGREAELPLWRMALAPESEIGSRARALEAALGGLEGLAAVELADGSSTTGGGSVPGGSIGSVLVEISPSSASPDTLARGLIDNDPPIIARIERDRVIIDLRTVWPEQDGEVAAALGRLLS